MSEPVRKISPEQLARMVDVFDRRAEVQRMMAQIMDEIKTGFVCLGMDIKTEELDLSTGQILPMQQPSEPTDESVVPGVSVNGRS